MRDKNVSDNKIDSSRNIQKKDSSNIAKSDTTNEINSYLTDYMKMYGKPEIIDSVFIFKGDTMQLRLNHYCTFDKSIRLPNKYISIYGLDSFITHSFQSDLVLKKEWH
jgi:hypothetical protein